MLDKEHTEKRMKESLETTIERKNIYQIVRAALEKWDGKKLTKRIANDVGEYLPDYNVLYTHDKPYWRRLVVIRKRKYVNKADLREEIVLHHDSHGEVFSIREYLDGTSGQLAHLIDEEMRMKQAIRTPHLLEDFDGTLETFASHYAKFKERMVAFKDVKYCVDRETEEFLKKFA